MPISAVDLFCGAGGLTHGLQMEGVDVRVGIDIDPSCEYPYSQNNSAEFLLRSVEDLHGMDLENYFDPGCIRLLAGCAPCQTFSSYNKKASTDDSRWWLLSHFSRLVNEVHPELITMENVPGLLKHGVFSRFLDDLEAGGYNVSYQVVKCEEYGIPQHRSRLVLLASRLAPITLIPPSEWGRSKTSTWEAIGGLPELKAGASDPNDPLHKCSALSPTNLSRIRASKPGGTWRDWPENLVAECHKKPTGKNFSGVYGRMRQDEPAPTMTTQFFGFGNGRFGHPSQDRAISLREGAILQGFPPTYRFVPEGRSVQMKAIGRLIGNAVPVGLGELIGASLTKHVKENHQALNLDANSNSRY